MIRSRRSLEDRVSSAAEAALKANGYVTPIDLFVDIGWTEMSTVRRWRQGQIEFLLDAMQINPVRVADAVALLDTWATQHGLLLRETQPLARTPDRPPLRFCRDVDDATNALFHRRWLSPSLSERKQASIQAQANNPPELLVIRPLNDAWHCHRCGKTGDWLIMEPPGPACLRCVGLDDLEFLPSGDALLTRRAKGKSARSAVVIRFSGKRRRYERQGVLVESQALAEAQREIATQRE